MERQAQELPTAEAALGPRTTGADLPCGRRSRQISARFRVYGLWWDVLWVREEHVEVEKVHQDMRALKHNMCQNDVSSLRLRPSNGPSKYFVDTGLRSATVAAF